MYKVLLSVLAGFFFLAAQAQQPVNLQDLLHSAEQHYPVASQKDLTKAIGKDNEKILDIGLYPQMTVSGQATYQSEVTKFNAPGITGFPSQKNDNYAIGLDLRFPLTEFSVVDAKKRLEQSKTSLSVSQLDVELQRIREKLTNDYSNIFLQQENKNILLLRITDLQSQLKKVSIGVTNGTVLKSNQLVFESEILSAQQRIADIDATILSLTQELSTLTGLVIHPDGNFLIPSLDSLHKTINRPELKVFELQNQVLDLQKEVLQKENKPYFFVFGQGFYGRPGYNFLNNNLRTYGIGGIGINWNINNTVIQKNKERTIELNKSIVNKQLETFNLNLKAVVAQKETEINKYQSIISRDEAIVNKRKEIMKVIASQLSNGTITSTEYLTELNAQNTAELNMVMHKVQQAIAIAQYNIIT